MKNPFSSGLPKPNMGARKSIKAGVKNGTVKYEFNDAGGEYISGGKGNPLSYTRAPAPIMNRGVRVAGKMPWKAAKVTTPESALPAKINPLFKGIKVSPDGKKYAPGSSYINPMRKSVENLLNKKGLGQNYR